MVPDEVILAIALVDLPIDVDDKDGIKVREGSGGSWWFLACECDDHYIGIVQEIISICTFQQIRALCFMKGGSSHSVATVISRATPKCQHLLTQALRFVGRFEFVGNAALYSDPSIGLKEFDALDFGGSKIAPDPQEEGRRVLLKCYSMKEPFLKEVRVIYHLFIFLILPASIISRLISTFSWFVFVYLRCFPTMLDRHSSERSFGS